MCIPHRKKSANKDAQAGKCLACLRNQKTIRQNSWRGRGCSQEGERWHRCRLISQGEELYSVEDLRDAGVREKA